MSGGTLAISGRLSNSERHLLNSGCTLSLSGSTAATDRVYDAAAVTIKGGGIFATGGLDEGTAPRRQAVHGGTSGLGALTFSTTTSSAHATIDFANTATGSTLVFSSLPAASRGAFVRVLNWTGTPGVDGGSPTNDRLLFQADPGFTAADLANFQFSNDKGDNYLSGAVLINYNGYYELVPPTVNTAPTASASPNPATTNEDTAVTITLTGTDADDNALTFSITQQPTYGTLTRPSPRPIARPSTPAPPTSPTRRTATTTAQTCSLLE